MRGKIRLFVLSLAFCLLSVLAGAIYFYHNLKAKQAENIRLLKQQVLVKSMHADAQNLVKSVLLFSQGERVKALEEYYRSKFSLTKNLNFVSTDQDQSSLSSLRVELIKKVEDLIRVNPTRDSMEFKLQLNEIVSLANLIELSENKILHRLQNFEFESADSEKRDLALIAFVLALMIGTNIFIVIMQLANGTKVVLELVSDKADVESRLQESARLALLGEMSAAISHEINNPLTVLSGRISQISRRVQAGEVISSQEIKEFSEKSAKIVNKIAQTIKSVQRAARKEGSEKVKINLGEVLRENIELCHDKAKSSGVALSYNSIGQPPAVLGNAAELSQVFLNLINNAIDAVENSANNWVKVEISSQALGYCNIRIIDSGPGIPVAVQEKMFKNFFTTKPVGKGTGLGLSICQRIVHSHGGSLEIDNSAVTTTFVVKLPLLQSSLKAG